MVACDLVIRRNSWLVASSRDGTCRSGATQEMTPRVPQIGAGSNALDSVGEPVCAVPESQAQWRLEWCTKDFGGRMLVQGLVAGDG